MRETMNYYLQDIGAELEERFPIKKWRVDFCDADSCLYVSGVCSAGQGVSTEKLRRFLDQIGSDFNVTVKMGPIVVEN